MHARKTQKSIHQQQTAASLLIKVAHLTGEQRYLDAAEKTLTAIWSNFNHYPVAHGSLLSALELFLHLEKKQLPELLSAKSAPGDGILAYPCRGSTCLPAISKFNEFREYLLDPAV